MNTKFKAHCLIDNKEVVIEERNDFFDDDLQRVCATNWHHVDVTKLIALELWWKGELKVRVTEKPEKEKWLFSHSAFMTFPDPKPQVESTTIGYPGCYFSVNEYTGEVY